MSDYASPTRNPSHDEECAKSPSSTIDRATATRTLTAARHLYRIAELIHSRRLPGDVDSALWADRSLSLLLGLLVRLHKDPVPDTFAELIERAGVIAAEEGLLAEDLSPDLIVVHEMRERLLATDAEMPPTDERRYDRALARCAEWSNAVRAYLDQSLPSTEPRAARWVAVGLALLVAFIAGMAVGGTRP